MENEEIAPSIYQHAAKFGLYLAGISIGLVVIFYVVDLSVLATFKFIALALIIALGYVIYAGINYRNSVGGFMTYGKAFTHGIVLMAVCGLITTVFNIVLYHVIDPDLPKNLGDAIMKNTEEMMRGFGAPDASIDEALDKMKDQMKTQFSIGNLAFGYIKAFIGYIIIVLITSIFVKKSQPEDI